MAEEVEATTEEKLLIFKLAVLATDNAVCGSTLPGAYAKDFNLLFDSRFETISNSYFKFKEAYIHEV